MNKGFISLTITLLVAGILLALVATSSLQTATFFDMALRKEYRFMNYHNAASCLDQAVLKLAQDYFFTTEVEIRIPYLNCTIVKVVAQENFRTITTRGDFQGSYVYRTAIVKMDIHSLEIVEWK